MDHAQPAESAAGSGDRRKAASGAFPDFEDDEESNAKVDSVEGETMRFPWSSTSASSTSTALPHPGTDSATGSTAKPTAHKKGLSGSILSRLSLLRTAEDERPLSREEQDLDADSFKPRKSTDDDDHDDEGDTSLSISPVKGEYALAAALRPIKTRRRKGSLRKTALLGGKRLGNEGRERRNSLLQRSPTSKPSAASAFQLPNTAPASPTALGRAEERDSSRPLRRLGHDASHPASSSESSWSEPAAVSTAKLSLVTDHKVPDGAPGDANNPDLGSPLDLKSPTSQTSYASTTDDDDVLTFDRPANAYSAQKREGIPPLNPLPSSAATGYFPSVVSSRRSSKQSRSSPLSHSITALSAYPEPEPHDYTETEYWGWVILFVTWVTFAVGMGSCLGIWSWAWDVGETPYAPPELEDDPTLPIVGYYPAVIVLTGVVAWVWITVAWVGMKYFRHAKIEV